MAITQKWHTSRGTACDTERAATIREDAENLAAGAQRHAPGIPFKLAVDMLDFLMTGGKLQVPTPGFVPECRTPMSAEEFHQLNPARRRIET